MSDDDPYHIKALQARLIYQLGKAAPRRARRLATTLARCSDARPCLSGACLFCGEQLQGVAVELTRDLVGGAARAVRGRKSHITLIPREGLAHPDQLSPATFERAAEATHRALAAAGVGPALFALDPSFNDDATGEMPPHWSVHTHTICADWLSKAQRAQLKAATSRSRVVKRPVKVDELDGRVNAPAYAFMPNRFRRERYLDDERPDGRAPCYNTRERRIRPNDAVELALVEHELGLPARIRTHAIDEQAVVERLRGFEWPRDGPIGR